MCQDDLSIFQQIAVHFDSELEFSFQINVLKSARVVTLCPLEEYIPQITHHQQNKQRWILHISLFYWIPLMLTTMSIHAAAAAAAAKSLQSYPTLCDPRDGSPPGSAIPGILQARVQEWGAIAFSNPNPKHFI